MDQNRSVRLGWHIQLPLVWWGLHPGLWVSIQGLGNTYIVPVIRFNLKSFVIPLQLFSQSVQSINPYVMSVHHWRTALQVSFHHIDGSLSYGDFKLIFFESCSPLQSPWLRQHVKVARDFKVAISISAECEIRPHRAARCPTSWFRLTGSSHSTQAIKC